MNLGKKTALRQGKCISAGADHLHTPGSGMAPEVEDILFSVASDVTELSVSNPETNPPQAEAEEDFAEIK